MKILANGYLINQLLEMRGAGVESISGMESVQVGVEREVS